VALKEVLRTPTCASAVPLGILSIVRVLHAKEKMVYVRLHYVLFSTAGGLRIYQLLAKMGDQLYKDPASRIVSSLWHQGIYCV
jgi:hypothetical protein